jgi:DtxR family Mn-dependent transcriptional regulator
MSTKKNIQHTHDHDLSHSMVHYLLSIHKLKEEKGYARVTDIANEMGLTKGSVSTALNNLKKRKLVIEDENKFLSLSDEGHNQVHNILSSRTLLYYFLKDFLNVPDEVAHKDSCLMEHLLSEETRESFFSFMKKLLDDKSTREMFSSELDLTKFDHAEEFFVVQKGDSYLTDE